MSAEPFAAAQPCLDHDAELCCSLLELVYITPDSGLASDVLGRKADCPLTWP